VVNVDATLVADSPRLAPHAEAIRAALARTLGIDEACVSVKGKRAEGLGFEGNGAGVSCRAVVLLARRRGA
jgi:2-C-methyl-D-erythritol 2,4-cyclodiphosphate synthase